jgi:hypothetical protein
MPHILPSEMSETMSKLKKSHGGGRSKVGYHAANPPQVTNFFLIFRAVQNPIETVVHYDLICFFSG